MGRREELLSTISRRAARVEFGQVCALEAFEERGLSQNVFN